MTHVAVHRIHHPDRDKLHEGALRLHLHRFDKITTALEPRAVADLKTAAAAIRLFPG